MGDKWRMIFYCSNKMKEFEVSLEIESAIKFYF